MTSVWHTNKINLPISEKRLLFCPMFMRYFQTVCSAFCVGGYRKRIPYLCCVNTLCVYWDVREREINNISICTKRSVAG